MKIYHNNEPRTRIGKIVHERDIRNGEVYDDGHPGVIWKRVGYGLEYQKRTGGEWTVGFSRRYFVLPKIVFSSHCRIIEAR